MRGWCLLPQPNKWGSIRSTQNHSHGPARLGELGLSFCIPVSQSFQPWCHPRRVKSNQRLKKKRCENRCVEGHSAVSVYEGPTTTVSLEKFIAWAQFKRAFSFWLAQSDFISVFGKRSFLQEECSQTRWLLGSVTYFFWSSECVNEIQSIQRLTTDAPLPTMEPNKRLWNCSRSRNYIWSLPNSLECRLFLFVIMWPTRTMVHCCLIWETNANSSLFPFSCLWYLCEHIQVFMCLRIPEVNIFDHVSTLRTEGGSLIWTQHWLMWPIKHPGIQSTAVPGRLLSAPLLCGYLDCELRSSHFCLWRALYPPFSQLQNYAGILLFYVIIKIS